MESAGFLERLSSAEPVPGGGSVAALQAAMSGALLVMVANLTIGRPKFSAVEREVTAIRDEAQQLRDRAASLAEEDIAAFQHVAHAMSLPRKSDEEIAGRRRQMQDALKGAAIPPLETMRVSSRLLVLAGSLAPIGNPSAVSDVGTAALAARAGFHAARLNVEINVAAVRDTQWVGQIQSKLGAFADADEIESQVLRATEKAIRGDVS